MISRATIVRIGQHYAKTYHYLATSDGACNRCGQYSRLVVRALNEHSLWKFKKPTRAHLIKLTKPRRGKFPRRHRYHREHQDIFEHVVVRIGSWTLDITRRQIEPRCAHPFVQHIDDVKRDWGRVQRLKWKP